MPAEDPTLGVVSHLARYPVKSLGGEDLAALQVDRRGVVGDRAWVVVDPDGRLGSGKTTGRFRRMPGLLELVASLEDGVPVVGFPDGRRLRADDPAVHDALSDHVGRPVRLEPEGEVMAFDEGPLHLVTTGSLARAAALHGTPTPVDVRRTRANLVLDTGTGSALDEDAWTGRRLAVGDDLVLAVREPMVRCVMVDQAQRDLPDAGGLLRTLGRHNGTALGLVLDVVAPGTVRWGDPVRAL